MITEEMMAAAAAEMNEAMLRSLPEPEDCYHEFSAKFEKKMKRVIYRADHPLQFCILQKAASFILVLFLGFATIMAICPTVRASVFGWIREQYESFMTYYFDNGPDADVRNSEYYLHGLDEQFDLMHSIVQEGKHIHIYNNEAGESIHFIYTTYYDKNAFYIKQENYYVEQVLINGSTGDVYTSIDESEYNCIIWGDTKTQIIFFISANMDRDELILLAENIYEK